MGEQGEFNIFLYNKSLLEFSSFIFFFVIQAKSQGRNSLRIVRKKSNTSTPKFDEMSIAASDFTMIG